MFKSRSGGLVLLLAVFLFIGDRRAQAQHDDELPMVRVKFARYETDVDYLSDSAKLLRSGAMPLKGVPDELVGLPFTKRDVGRGLGGVQLNVTGAITVYVLEDFHRAQDDDQKEFDQWMIDDGWVRSFEQWATTVGKCKVYRKDFKQATGVTVPGIRWGTLSVTANRMLVNDSTEIYSRKTIDRATTQPTTQPAVTTAPTASTVPVVLPTTNPATQAASQPVMKRIAVPSASELVAGGKRDSGSIRDGHYRS